MNKTLLFLFGLIFSTGVLAQTDLFFSEYIEGSGNNKALEIYNPTNKVIDLTKYYVARFSNGSTTYSSGGITQLKGTLEPYKTFVLVNGQTTSTATSPACDPILQGMANQLDIPYPSPTHMNGNDAIALLKTESGNLADALPVDLIGEIGLGSKIKEEEGWAPFSDTIITYTISDKQYYHTITDYIIKAKDDSGKASYGPYWLAWTQDHTLRRKYDVYEGVKENPTPFNVSLEWDTISIAGEGINSETGEKYTFRKYKDIWDGLGKHECIVTKPGFPNKVDLDPSKSTIKAYPTIIKNQPITIESSSAIKEITVLNLNGEIVLKNTFISTNTIELDLSGLKSGMYFVYTYTEEQTQRVIQVIVN